jgi:hypothetical protein
LRGILLDRRSHGKIEAGILSGRTDLARTIIRIRCASVGNSVRINFTSNLDPFDPPDHLKDVPGNLEEENPDVEEDRRP